MTSTCSTCTGGVGLAGSPVVNPSATPVPFGFTFDRRVHLVVTEAGTSALTTYSVARDGRLTELGSTTDGLAALCWVATNGTLLLRCQRRECRRHQLHHRRLRGPDGGGHTRRRTPGPVDLATSLDGRSLYVETGAGDLVDSFAVQSDGTLVSTGSVAPELPGPQRTRGHRRRVAAGRPGGAPRPPDPTRTARRVAPGPPGVRPTGADGFAWRPRWPRSGPGQRSAMTRSSSSASAAVRAAGRGRPSRGATRPARRSASPRCAAPASAPWWWPSRAAGR